MSANPASTSDDRLLLLDGQDNVLAITRAVRAGETLLIEGASATIDRGAGIGFKVARRAIKAGDPIVKYGAVIGVATADIAGGHLVHTHNVESRYLPSTEAVARGTGKDSTD